MANQLYDNMQSEAEKELVAILNDSQPDSNVDIDQTLNDKAMKNQLTKRNVKNLIKNVLTNDDVAIMLRQTLNDDLDGNCLYEPKLTRAKIREMSITYPPQLSPIQQQPIISESECRLLIEKEFPDDSEDEEYHPDKTLEEEEDDDYDDESKCTEINKSFETDCEAESSVNIKEKAVVLNDKETIGMRTRSKLSLNDTPLEIIEQAFIPPDITEDMYDSACENDEWMEFLSEFTKPLEFVQNDDNEDDPEYNVLCDDDFTSVDQEEFRIDKSVRISRKEYNDLMNELYEFTESYIEFNGGNVGELLETNAVITDFENDKNTVKPNHSSLSMSVCTPNNSELKSNSNCIINDNIIDKNFSPSTSAYTLNVLDWKSNTTCSTIDNIEAISKVTYPFFPVNTLNYSDCKLSTAWSMNDLQMTEVVNYSTQLGEEPNLSDLNNHQMSISAEKTNLVPQNIIVCDKKKGMSTEQLFLLKQQLAQHVQLITQHYILCTKEKSYKILCRKLKNMLNIIKKISEHKIYTPINLSTSFEFIQEWIEIQNDDIDTNWNNISLPLYLKEFMLFYDRPVFIYPHLLPSKTFSLDYETHPMGPSEEKVLVHKINYLFKRLTELHRTRAKYKNSNIFDMLPMILKIVQKRWFSHRKLTDLKMLITRRKKTLEPKPLKKYLVDGEIEIPRHIVDIGNLFASKCLLDFDIKQFPTSWKHYVRQKKFKNKINKINK
ncbi:uncharacterized protein LOC112689793 [Sipha flava]|uniref:Uncharacterized protein LOC112689793 n=2 Tax=Sipha flava TaxID=143950 RepID=A0A8B8G979_9HEMI|nr:uncharacterized protein LOC112689793 [Sipha flava]